MLIFVVILTITTFLINYANSDAQDTVKSIRGKILTNYNKNVRPVVDKSRPIFLAAKMHFFHIDTLNEKEQSIVVHGVFQMSWNDEYLKWEPSKYNETKFILMKNYELWTPQIVLANTAKQSAIDYFWNLPIKVWHTGMVYASPEFTFDVSCLFDFSDYPYDTQTCPMAFFANGLSMSELNWTLIMEPELHLYWPDANQKTRISKWIISATSAKLKYWSQGGLSMESPNKTFEVYSLPLAEMSISFKRKDVYFPLTIILPAILTSLLTLTALLPHIRLKNSLFVLLVNFLLQSFYADNLLDVLPPSLATLPRIAKFYAFNFCCTTVAILIRIWLLFAQIRHAEQILVEKRLAEEASNQERLPQAQPRKSSSSAVAYLDPYFEPKRFVFIIFGTFVVLYFLFALIFLF